MGRSLRLVAAIVFLVIAAYQPGLNAHANAGGSHDMETAQVSSHHAPAETCHHGTASSDDIGAADHAIWAADQQNCDNDRTSGPLDQSCKIHCAPAVVLPVGAPHLFRPAQSRHAPSRPAVLTDGFAPEFIKPPRT